VGGVAGDEITAARVVVEAAVLGFQVSGWGQLPWPAAIYIYMGRSGAAMVQRW
jgi:hypothetical protein